MEIDSMIDLQPIKTQTPIGKVKLPKYFKAHIAKDYTNFRIKNWINITKNL
jgi:hypothetical protein